MGLLNGYGSYNRIVTEPTKTVMTVEQYNNRVSVGNWTRTKSYQYVGMNHAAALMCFNDKQEKYKRFHRTRSPGGLDKGVERTMGANVQMSKSDGDMWTVTVDVNDAVSTYIPTGVVEENLELMILSYVSYPPAPASSWDYDDHEEEWKAVSTYSISTATSPTGSSVEVASSAEIGSIVEVKAVLPKSSAGLRNSCGMTVTRLNGTTPVQFVKTSESDDETSFTMEGYFIMPDFNVQCSAQWVQDATKHEINPNPQVYKGGQWYSDIATIGVETVARAGELVGFWTRCPRSEPVDSCRIELFSKFDSTEKYPVTWGRVRNEGDQWYIEGSFPMPNKDVILFCQWEKAQEG